MDLTLEEMMPKTITLGQLKQMAEQLGLTDDAQINFIFRENLMDDSGRDYRFEPTVIWGEGKQGGDKPDTLTLVSVFGPTVDGAEGCDCNSCEEDCDEETH